MNNPTLKRIKCVLKRKYGLTVGEFSLRKLQDEISFLLRKKIIVTGRSYSTGRKKTLILCLSDIFS